MIKTASEGGTLTARSVEDISEAVGYASSSDLYRHFKSTYGISPNVWRRKQ